MANGASVGQTKKKKKSVTDEQCLSSVLAAKKSARCVNRRSRKYGQAKKAKRMKSGARVWFLVSLLRCILGTQWSATDRAASCMRAVKTRIEEIGRDCRTQS